MIDQVKLIFSTTNIGCELLATHELQLFYFLFILIFLIPYMETILIYRFIIKEKLIHNHFSFLGKAGGKSHQIPEGSASRGQNLSPPVSTTFPPPPPLPPHFHLLLPPVPLIRWSVHFPNDYFPAAWLWHYTRRALTH